jgi:nucleotide-binding universal stress UspA family protein
MRMIKKILVAVDFSPCSRAALKQALSLSEQLGGSVDALHVAEVPTFRREPRVASAEGLSTLREYALQEGKAELAAFLTELPPDLRSRVQPRVQAGRPRDVIIAAAADYDLLVMGTNGRTGRAHSLAGSVTESVVQVAPCPLLAVRELG